MQLPWQQRRAMFAVALDLRNGRRVSWNPPQRESSPVGIFPGCFMQV